MALIKLQQPYQSFRGRNATSGGQVLYPRGSRNFARTFVQPANPSSTVQAAIRSFFTLAAQAYQSTSDNERLAWATLAASMLRTDKNGDSYAISRQAAYQSINVYRQMDAQAITDAAPAYSLAPGNTAGEVTVDDPLTSLGITFATPEAANTGFVLVELSDPLPGVARQARDSDCTNPCLSTALASSIIPVTAGVTSNISIAVAALRKTWAVGDRIGVKLTSLDANYVPGQSTLTTLTITAP